MKKFFIVKLMGGIGNQLFQYCFAKYLSEKYNIRCKLDVLSYEFSNKRQNQLNSIGLEFDEAEKTEIPLIFRNNLNKLRYLCFSNKVVVEKFESKENIISRSPEGRYYWGYWQDPFYADQISSDVFKDFKRDRTHVNEKYLKICMSERSVALHVRKGDYTDKKNSTVYEELGVDYYKKAWEHARKMIVDPTPIIFSNDIKYCKANLTFLRNPVFVEDTIDLEDLYLMSLCAGNIIANSTFSWWGAYLNRNGRFVVIPRKWYKDRHENNLIVDGWLAV